MKFAATFGQRYNWDDAVHPVIPEVTGSSFLEVEAPSDLEARLVLRDALGNDYAFIYAFDADFERQIEQYGLVEVPWRIHPTSCRCGGSYAWLRRREGRADEMVGCVCHQHEGGPTVPQQQPAQLAQAEDERQPVATYENTRHGGLIKVYEDGSLKAWNSSGKRKQTTATADKLRAGYGDWVLRT